MKVYFLISGVVRSFFDTLYPFLCQVSTYIDCEFLLCITNDTVDTYYTKQQNSDKFNEFTKNPRARITIIDNIVLTSYSELNQREKNTVYQWYRIQKCFNFLVESDITPNDLIVRIRPDIEINNTPYEFATLLKQLDPTVIYIPSGKDIFNISMIQYTDGCINDQFAIGPYNLMKVYCNLYTSVNFKEVSRPIISEGILYSYIHKSIIPVKRIVSLSYKLNISDCKILAIAGDSGSGKSTIVDSIQLILPRDLGSIMETDCYHKWERGHENWKQLTHLNPDANNLEKMSDDICLLKSGEAIACVDYDHSSGKFTDSYSFKMKKLLIVSGLHTLYKQELRNSIDHKLYVNTQYELKRFWKIQRDMKYRGYSFDKAATSFSSREKDFQLYIVPQIEFADIIIHYTTNDTIPTVFDTTIPPPSVQLGIEIKIPQSDCIDIFLEKISTRTEGNKYIVDSTLDKNILLEHVPEIYKKYINIEYIKDGILGVLQCFTILLLYNNTIA